MNRGKKDGDNTSDEKVDDNTQNFLSMWSIPTEFINHFNLLTDPKYTKEEVDELKAQYNDEISPNTNHVNQLLNAIDSFLLATTINQYFKELRDKNYQEIDRIQVLNNMASALTTILDRSDKLLLNNQPEAAVLNSAFQYGVAVIKHRLKALDKEQDDIYKSYSEKTNKLKIIVENNPPVSSRHTP